jgi:hypothetical protein
MVKLRKQNKTKRQSKQTKHKAQSGGFYPSVYGGISSATILLPMLVRQLIYMYTNPSSTRKTRKVKENKRKK